MKKIYCIKWNQYRRFKSSKISYMFDKTLVLSIICDKFGSIDEKIFNEEESIKYQKFFFSYKHRGVPNKNKIISVSKHKSLITKLRNLRV